MNLLPMPPTAERERSVTDCFEAISETQADRIAVDDGETRLSYAALNARANRLARAIRQVLPDENGVIALMLSFGAPAVAGYLGAMKTRLPSVRLDPATPNSQNRNVLADAGADLLVTDAAHLRSARSLAGKATSVMGIEDIDPAMPAGNLETKVSPDTVATITYTSGSTGAPKGYCHSHRYLVDAAGLLQELGGITAESRFMLPFGIATGPHLSYSVSVLLSGGTLCPFPLGTRGPSAFLDVLGRATSRRSA